MSRRTPALVRAEILARIHFGLPPLRESLKGHIRGVHKTVLGKLDDGGFTIDDQLTEQGYLELAEVCRKLAKQPTTFATEGV